MAQVKFQCPTCKAIFENAAAGSACPACYEKWVKENVPQLQPMGT